MQLSADQVVEITKCLEWFKQWLSLDLGETLSSHQLMLLLNVAVKGGEQVSQTETFEDLSFISRSSLSRSLSTLIKANLIDCRQDPGNRRKNLLSLTKEGEAVIQHLY